MHLVSLAVFPLILILLNSLSASDPNYHNTDEDDLNDSLELECCPDELTVKRAPMRFGKRASVISPDIIEMLRFNNDPGVFSSFKKKAPMRFGKRAPMRFGKRDLEDMDTVVEEFNDIAAIKRAPMRFGKRLIYSDNL